MMIFHPLQLPTEYLDVFVWGRQGVGRNRGLLEVEVLLSFMKTMGFCFIPSQVGSLDNQ